MNRLLLFLSLIGCSLGAVAQVVQEPLEAEIELREESENLTVTAVFRNNTRTFVDYEYRFSVERSGLNGTVSSTQKNQFSAGPQQHLELSTITLNRDSADRYGIVLEIVNRRGKVILLDKLEIGGKKKVSYEEVLRVTQPRPVPEAAIVQPIEPETSTPDRPDPQEGSGEAPIRVSELVTTAPPREGPAVLPPQNPQQAAIPERKALPLNLNLPQPDLAPEVDRLIINQTSSRAGTDFYGYFINHWAEPDRGYYTIVLGEQYARGRAVNLTVSVNGTELVNQTFVPSSDYLEQLAKNAAEYLIGYIDNGSHLVNFNLNDVDQLGNGY